MGLDGCQEFVELAQKRTGCEILHQDFLKLNLKPFAFDGVFANASLFHVPTQELERVLVALHTCLRFNGVFFVLIQEGPILNNLTAIVMELSLNPKLGGTLLAPSDLLN